MHSWNYPYKSNFSRRSCWCSIEYYYLRLGNTTFKLPLLLAFRSVIYLLLRLYSCLTWASWYGIQYERGSYSASSLNEVPCWVCRLCRILFQQVSVLSISWVTLLYVSMVLRSCTRRWVDPWYGMPRGSSEHRVMS